jgi:hypothetical protein
MAITIKKRPCPPSSVGATLMQTGQTTVYRTGDDADTRSEGRATDFFTLASNNPFGNTNRFTDELGGSTYTNNIVIDWSTYNGATVLGVYRTHLITIVNTTWDTAIDDCLSLSVGTFTGGWRLWNRLEACNFMKNESAYQYSYSPLNGDPINNSYWNSTTYFNSTPNAYRTTNIGEILISLKSGASGTKVAVRTFTVTGTTLT